MKVKIAVIIDTIEQGIITATTKERLLAPKAEQAKLGAFPPGAGAVWAAAGAADHRMRTRQATAHSLV